MILKNYYWLSTNPFYKGFADDIKKEGLKQRQTDGLIGDHGKNVKKNLLENLFHKFNLGLIILNLLSLKELLSQHIFQKINLQKNLNP